MDRPLRQLRSLIPKLIERFGKTCLDSKEFLNTEPKGSQGIFTPTKKDPNTLIFGELEIHLGTVHSVKGQTHTATLYLESFYQKDGSGVDAKSYESQRLAAQFKGKKLLPNAKKRVRESARMVYVGFSRPTHLLAFAVHKERFDMYFTDLDTEIWEVVELNNGK